MNNRKEKTANRGKTLQNVGQKFLKKMGAACLTSALIVSSICSSIAVNASTTILRGDINGDGVAANLSDVIALGQYFSGTRSVSVDVADVDGNGVANSVDLSYLVSKSFNDPVTPTWTTNKIVNNPTSNNVGVYTYEKWNYIDGEPDTPTQYTQTIPAPSYTPSGIMPMATIGATNDQPAYTNAALVRFYYRAETGYGSGTGFIIDSDTILTAAHCVYADDDNDNIFSRYTDVYVFCKNTKNTPNPSDDVSDTYNAVSVHIPAEWPSSTNPEYDLALVKVDTNGVDLTQEYGKLNIGLITDDKLNSLVENSNATNIMVPGYSSGYLDIGYGNLADLSTTNLYSNDLVLSPTADTDSGDSGGPILYDADGNFSTKNDITVIGIYRGSKPIEDEVYNLGARITTRLLSFFFGNNNL
jgi:V8-like Glu-specific endopeptidase